MNKTIQSQTFGKLIRNLRETKKKLLRQAAADLEVDQAVLSKLENGLLLPNETMIGKLSSYYKINVDELKILAYAGKIVGEFGEFKYAEKVMTIVKEQLGSFGVKQKEDRRRGEK